MKNILKGNSFFLHIILGSLLANLAFSAFALEVSTSELKTTSEDKIVFKSYTGPVSVVQTKRQIAEIGGYIGGNIAKDVYNSGSFSYSPKYKILHAVNPKVKEKLDADIIILSDGAGVDHIKNLRLIISTYLSKAYGYSTEDADTLAVFITVYNAVYRGNMEVFNEKYKDSVTKYLTQEKVGLSLNYEDWPGKTQIVIPLSDLDGGISTIDTSLISDQNVVNSMRENDDKGVDERKNMLDLKNREADEAELQAKEAQEKHDENEVIIAEEEKQLAQEKEDEKEIEQQIEQDKVALQENPDDQEAQQRLAEDEEKLAETRDQISQTEQNIEDKREENEKLEKTVSEKQNLADKKREEASSDTGNIAKDQKEVIDTKNKNDAVKNAVYGLKLKDENLKTSSIVKIDGDTSRIMAESEIDVIRGRTMYETTTGFVCIAGVNSGNGAVKLVNIEKDSMEISIASNEVVYEDSIFLENSSSYILVISTDSGDYKLAKFDDGLSLTAVSDVSVNPNTPAVISSKGIIVQDKDNSLVILDTKNLLQK